MIRRPYRFLNAATILAAAFLILSACRKDDKEASSQKKYSLTEMYRFTPDEFAEHVFNPESPVSEELGEFVVATEQAAVKAKNLALGVKMARETASLHPDWGYRKFVLEYKSKDARGKDITLSEVVALPVGTGWDHHPDKIVLSSHFTLYSDIGRPSGPYADIMMAVAASDAVFISPDLEGYGASVERVHPFLAHDVIARQSVDGVLAALQLLEDQGITLKEGYKLFNVGYSQGGSYALAIHKYMENRCSRREKDLLKLTKTYSCGGVYAPKETFFWYLEQERILFPGALPLVVDGMLSAHPKIMAGLREEDFFTQKFMDCGIFDLIHEKGTGMPALHDYIHEKVGWNVSDILSEDLLTPGTKVRTALEQALAEEDLTRGWYPVKPVVLYHATDDLYVPFLNATQAMLGLGTGNIKLVTIPPLSENMAHYLTGVVYYFRVILGELE